MTNVFTGEAYTHPQGLTIGTLIRAFLKVKAIRAPRAVKMSHATYLWLVHNLPQDTMPSVLNSPAAPGRTVFGMDVEFDETMEFGTSEGIYE